MEEDKQAPPPDLDGQVERALFQRACGIRYEETTYETKLDKETGEYVEICAKRVSKFLPPDPSSAVFWLTNRLPDRWKHKPEARALAAGGGVVMLAPVMDDPGPPEKGGGDG